MHARAVNIAGISVWLIIGFFSFLFSFFGYSISFAGNLIHRIQLYVTVFVVVAAIDEWIAVWQYMRRHRGSHIERWKEYVQINYVENWELEMQVLCVCVNDESPSLSFDDDDGSNFFFLSVFFCRLEIGFLFTVSILATMRRLIMKWPLII